MSDAEQSRAWPKGISAITLFVEDLDEAKRFYGEVFALPLTFEDADSAVFDFGNTIINLLKTTAAHELIGPARSRPASPRPSASSSRIRASISRARSNIKSPTGAETIDSKPPRASRSGAAVASMESAA